MNRVARSVVIVMALVGVAGCRDVVEPFSAGDRAPPPPVPRRLTYSHGDDRSPAWSSGSDTVYYSASRSEFDRSEGVLMAIHRDGGVARPLLAAQLGATIPARLVEPAQAPTTLQLAFLELRTMPPDLICGADTMGGNTLTSFACDSDGLPTAALGEVWLHTADAPRAATWSLLDTLNFAGRATLTRDRINGYEVFETRYSPAQLNWVVERALPARPSWSPDGRLLSADDAGIRVVDREGRVTVIATGDVANPAWSRDGEWIAFDRVERLDSLTDVCLMLIEDRRQPGSYNVGCYERRIFYETTPPVVLLIRPDGAGLSELAPGSDPTWHPNGESLVYVTPAGIVRHHLESGAIEQIPGTEQGRQPAVSPDGRWLAFTRFDERTREHDVWLVALDGASTAGTGGS